MAEIIEAPWAPDQVTYLNAFQQAGYMHPFTCGGTGHGNGSPVLVAYEDGWHCPRPECDYRQTWAHAFMAAGSCSGWGLGTVPNTSDIDQHQEQQ